MYTIEASSGELNTSCNVDSISVHSNKKQRTVLPTKRVIVYFLPMRCIAKLSIYHYKKLHISPLVCVLCVCNILDFTPRILHRDIKYWLLYIYLCSDQSCIATNILDAIRTTIIIDVICISGWIDWRQGSSCLAGRPQYTLSFNHTISKCWWVLIYKNIPILICR